MQLEKILQFWHDHRPDRKAEDLLRRWGGLVVAVFAVCYYAQYFRSGLNLGGEGGTVAVVAMRLMEGQRPMVDMFLGYNVMWFYPVAWVFELTGPNYLALRFFFFALCTVTGVMSFYVVRRVTGLGWLATVVALGPVLIPGMMFRNYMGFLAMLNMLLLLQAYVFEHRTDGRQRAWMAAAGAALGLTYLVRIDLGAFFTVITLGLIGLYPLGKRGEMGRRLRQAVWGLVLTAGLFALTHAPFYWDAHRRGYAEPFASQYTNWISLVRYLAELELAKRTASPPSTGPVAPAETPPTGDAAAAEPVARDVEADEYLQKQSWEDFFDAESFYDRAFVLITYLPVPVALLIVLPAGMVLLVALARGNFPLRTEALAVLITTGSALTLFAQYFFFRPDTPHLSEFMVPFMVAMACAMWTAAHWARGRRFVAVWAGIVILFCLANTGLYFYHSFPKESAGTLAAARKRNVEMVAENGVRVFLKRQEKEELQALCDLVKTHSRPGDYLVSYPYSPTVNFMTDRPSFEYNLYVDNAHNVSSFHEESLEEFARHRPAVIVIDNRAINKTEASRFKNWAAQTYAWIRKNYTYAGTFRRQELYFRPDLGAPAASRDDLEPHTP